MHDRLGAVLGGDEDRAVGVMEHPEPPIGLAGPHPVFVRGQRGARQEPRLDQARPRGKKLSAGSRMLTSASLMVSLSNHANVQAEQTAQHVAQSRQPNALDGAQIDHKGAQVWPVLRRAQEAIPAPSPPAARP